MPIIPALPTFSPNTTADANDLTTALTNIRDAVNTYGMLTDVARTVTAVQTFSAAPVFSAGWSAGAGCTVTTGGLIVSAGGVTVTGNSTITGTLGGVTTLTVTTVGATTFSGAPNFSGTPTFGAGFTLTGGTATIATLGLTTLNMGASGKIVSGSTSTVFRNNADTTTVFSFTESSGNTSLHSVGGGTLTVSSGGTGSVVLGAGVYDTTEANGHVRIGYMLGVPSGAAGRGAIVIDETNSRLYVRFNASWKYASLT